MVRDLYVNEWNTASYLFYLAMMLLSALLAFFSCKTEDTLKQGEKYSVRPVMLLGAFLPMLITLGIRHMNRGRDLVGYLDYFRTLVLSPLAKHIRYLFQAKLEAEPGFKLYEFIVARILCAVIGGPAPVNKYVPVFCFSTAFLWLCFAYRAVREEAGKNGTIIAVCCVFIQLFFSSFSMIRQTIAIAMMLYAFTQLADGRRKKFWVYLIVASTFHYTALIGVFAFFYSEKATENRRLGVIFRVIVLVMLILFFAVGPEVLSALLSRFRKYSFFAGQRREFGFGQLAMHLPVVGLLLYFKKPLVAQNEHNSLYIDLTVFDLFVAQLNYANPMFSRFDRYFSALCIFWVPSLFQLVLGKFGKKVAVTGAAVGILIWFTLRILYYIYVLPYQIMPYYINESIFG